MQGDQEIRAGLSYTARSSLTNKHSVNSSLGRCSYDMLTKTVHSFPAIRPDVRNTEPGEKTAGRFIHAHDLHGSSLADSSPPSSLHDNLYLDTFRWTSACQGWPTEMGRESRDVNSRRRCRRGSWNTGLWITAPQPQPMWWHLHPFHPCSEHCRLLSLVQSWDAFCQPTIGSSRTISVYLFETSLTVWSRLTSNTLASIFSSSN